MRRAHPARGARPRAQLLSRLERTRHRLARLLILLSMKRFILALPVALLLAGCNAQTPNPTSGIAASFVAGRAFDRSQTALKSGNDKALQNAGRKYARAAGQLEDKGVLLAGVQPITLAAMRLELQAKYAPLSQRDALMKGALEKYRAASAFLPANPRPGQVDAETLNMVGYPLADRGTTRADWQRAAQLTRLSLAEWDRQIKPLAPGSRERLQLEAARTIGALDSYAWSLFKLGRTGEALQKQEKVMAFAEKNPGQLNAEIPYHMAEIYRAAGRDDDAQQQYGAALGLSPDPELLLRIDSALNATQI